MNETIPAKFFSYEGAKKTILFSHGNAEDIGRCFRWMEYLSKILRVNVMIYEYTGYGLSTGKPSEEKIYADIRAAYSFLINEKKILPKDIILYGRSLGSGPTLDLAQELKDDVGGIILQSPFTTIVKTKLPKSPPSWILKDMFENEKKIQSLHPSTPVIIIHGSDDPVVPVKCAKRLAELISKESSSFLLLDGASHNNIERCYRHVVLPHIHTFLLAH